MVIINKHFNADLSNFNLSNLAYDENFSNEIYIILLYH